MKVAPLLLCARILIMILIWLPFQMLILVLIQPDKEAKPLLFQNADLRLGEDKLDTL